MDRQNFGNHITAQIRQLDEMVETVTEKRFDRNSFSDVLPEEKAKKIRRVIMTGCAGSYSAAGAMAEAFRRISGIRYVHHPDPMEFTRYYSDFDLTKGHDSAETLVVTIGRDEDRMIRDILKKGKEKGCPVLLIGSDNDIRSYFASMITLLGLASHLGKANGHFEEAEEKELITGIKDYVHEVMKDYACIDEQMSKEAQRMKEFRNFDLVGDWSDTWSAQFVGQQLIQCCGVQATHTNSEEWVHISMMNKEPETIGTMFMITADSNSYGRIVDTSWGSARLGRPTIVVSDGKREDFKEDLKC